MTELHVLAYVGHHQVFIWKKSHAHTNNKEQLDTLEIPKGTQEYNAHKLLIHQAYTQRTQEANTPSMTDAYKGAAVC
jgi:hypothetical protein